MPHRLICQLVELEGEPVTELPVGACGKGHKASPSCLCQISPGEPDPHLNHYLNFFLKTTDAYDTFTSIRGGWMTVLQALTLGSIWSWNGRPSKRRPAGYACSKGVAMYFEAERIAR